MVTYSPRSISDMAASSSSSCSGLSVNGSSEKAILCILNHSKQHSLCSCMSITLAWWNTGLSPTKAPNRASSDERKAASLVVQILIEMRAADLVVLGEVTDADMDAIQVNLGPAAADFKVIKLQEKVGRGKFDTALFHRSTISVTSGKAIVRRELERTTRVAQRLEVSLPGQAIIRLFVSHWPSRNTIGTWEPERFALGTALREAINDAQDEFPKAPIVCLGDFNDEPFDPSLDRALVSSRDKYLVEETPALLYNPFWRHMTSYEHASPDHRFCDKGTYFHTGGNMTKWRTVDQMLVSSSIVTGVSGWKLDEAHTRVVDVPELIALVQDNSSVFDHLPIIGKLDMEAIP